MDKIALSRRSVNGSRHSQPVKALRLGWLADNPPYQGGAELTAATLLKAAPDWAEILPCPSGDIRDDVDAYVVHNCTQYGRDSLPLLARKPVFKVVHDAWSVGDSELRSWLLSQSALVVFFSRIQRTLFGEIAAPTAVMPAAIDLTPFKEAARHSPKRAGVVWLGRMYGGKVVEAALAWAGAHHTEVDFYGQGPLASIITGQGRYCGRLDVEDVPWVLARYEALLFLPSLIEPFGRVAAEAWAAGCQVITNGNLGALEWLQEAPDALEQGVALFWQALAEGLSVRHE